jgi:hypothetical protein
MTLKNILLYLFLLLIEIIGRAIGLILYPTLVFPLRHQIIRFMNARVYEDEVNHIYVLKPCVKKRNLIHPYFLLFWFLTGLHDQFAGPDWYKRKLKEKWFGEFLGVIEMFAPVEPYNLPLKMKLQYLYLCFCWAAWRNAFTGFNEWFREGKYMEGTLKVAE